MHVTVSPTGDFRLHPYERYPYRQSVDDEVRQQARILLPARAQVGIACRVTRRLRQSYDHVHKLSGGRSHQIWVPSLLHTQFPFAHSSVSETDGISSMIKAMTAKRLWSIKRQQVFRNTAFALLHAFQKAALTSDLGTLVEFALAVPRQPDLACLRQARLAHLWDGVQAWCTSQVKTRDETVAGELNAEIISSC